MLLQQSDVDVLLSKQYRKRFLSKADGNAPWLKCMEWVIKHIAHHKATIDNSDSTSSKVTLHTVHPATFTQLMSLDINCAVFPLKIYWELWRKNASFWL